ncbi:acyltransferase family protein [Alkalicoccobacillus murimartini]|uniref:Fucose 4-O-acetylase-like acetyltransferase n=1 Tax=Alkalicoccobacillus murimartini TaxID=171685 RepID=A0ABT9YH23_9BACI|nr:acyltransferase family protein [Alkalicoccobacillus murimartini]MDQ0207168.1 fucose 4-O-acetylase-like acetyltransferase [Alkalicoccobacillus murimartini]
MDKRVRWIDTAKGIGIILVVMSHAPINDTFKDFLFAFHMPLFFYLSGIVYKTSTISPGSFLLKKARGLLLPYFLFSFITYVLWFFVTRHFPFTSGDDVDPVVPFSGIFISTPQDYQLTYNPAIWFLTCLFVVEVLFYFYDRISKGRGLPIFLISCGILGYASSMLFESNALPWSILVALTAIVFYGLGYLTKHVWSTISWPFVIPAVSLLFFVTYVAHTFNSERIDMRGNVYGEVWFFYLGAIAGAVAIILLAHKLARFNFLVYLGQFSIVILVLHFTALNLVKASVYYGLGYEMSDTTTLPWTLFYTTVTLLLMIPCIMFLKQFPMLLGKGRKKTKTP